MQKTCCCSVDCTWTK